MKKEIEVKIKLNKGEREGIRLKLNEFSSATPLLKETTYGFFTEDRQSIEKGIFPRIKEFRNNNEGLLTVKVKKENNKDYFRRDEYEIKINDVKFFRDFLKIVGYGKEIIFEKERESWKIPDSVLVNLDILPFGEFIEIEGKPEQIEKMAKELGLESRERTIKAYLALWDDYRKENNISEENCLFKN